MGRVITCIEIDNISSGPTIEGTAYMPWSIGVTTVSFVVEWHTFVELMADLTQ